MLFYVVLILFGLPLLLMFPTKIINKRKVPKKGGVILCGNHQSNVDIVILALHFRRQKFLGKKELGKFFLARWFLKGLGAILINRKKPGVEAYKKCIHALEKGWALTIFPEGTRNKLTDEEMLAMKNGAVMFAMKTGVPIVPMAFINKPKLFKRNVLVVGDPFVLGKPDKITKDDLKNASELLSSKILSLKNNYLKENAKS